MPLSHLRLPISLERICAGLPWARAGSWQSYLLATAFVVGATLIRIAVAPWVSGVQFITFFPAVILTTFLCGMRAGTCAVVLSAFSAWFFIIPPQSLGRVYALALFLLVAGADVVIIGALRTAVARARALYSGLLDSEARFRGMLESAPDAMVVADRAGRIVLINAMTERTFGYTRQEMLGNQVELLMPDRFARNHIAHRARYHELPQPRAMGSDLSLLGRRKDGTEFPIEVSLSPVETSEGLLVFGAIRDISIRKQYEIELARAKLRAEKASRAKSEFLSQMSHELRTPLNAVIGFAQILRLNQDNTLTGRQFEYCDYILKGGFTLLRLVNEILDLEQAESGKVKLSLERVVVADALRTLRETAAPLAANAEVTLEVGAAWAVPDIRADAFRLQQVLLNLTANAIKYNRPGGSVVINAVRVPSGRVRFVVTDTGIGIPAERQPELFKPFSRLGAESTEIQGTGIGLAYSKTLTEAMGGSIDFTSKEGEGSAFWIELPADAGDHEAPATAATGSAADPLAKVSLPAKRFSMLCVEDNPVNLRLIEQLIATLPDVAILSAETPSLGLELSVAHQPDIILLDINLPGMTGFDLLAKLKALPATRGTPVIAVSAAATPADVRRGLEAGFFRYLTKPIDVHAFFKAIDEALATGPSTPASETRGAR